MLPPSLHGDDVLVLSGRTSLITGMAQLRSVARRGSLSVCFTTPEQMRTAPHI